MRSDNEELEVHIPRPAANVKPAHLGADLSPLLIAEVKRALQHRPNFEGMTVLVFLEITNCLNPRGF